MTTPTQRQKAEFTEALRVLITEWDRCMAIALAEGISREEAAKIVGAHLTTQVDRAITDYRERNAA